MTDTITLTGLVATIPKQLTTTAGAAHTSFRLASSQRRFDTKTGSWVDGETNWYTINAFRQLATNLNNSIEKGHRVVVSGRLRIRDWATTEKSGTNIDIDADAIGHDLRWGTAKYLRSISTAALISAPSDVLSTGAAGNDSGSTPSDYSTNFPPSSILDQESWPTVVPGSSSVGERASAGLDPVEAEVPF